MPEKPWREDLVAALASIGGAGCLDDIYQAVEKIRQPLPKEWKGTVRCKLQQFSSDSHWWRKSTTRNRADLFTNPRWGYWELRQRPVPTDPESVRLLQQQVADLTQQVRRLEHRVRALRVLFFTAPPARPSRRNR